jgi:hypothetical protein
MARARIVTTLTLGGSVPASAVPAVVQGVCARCGGILPLLDGGRERPNALAAVQLARSLYVESSAVAIPFRHRSSSAR